MASKKANSLIPNFDNALKKLEAIVQQMENDELNLEQALKQFEQGVALARQCQQALKQAEQRVQQLITENPTPADALQTTDQK